MVLYFLLLLFGSLSLTVNCVNIRKQNPEDTTVEQSNNNYFKPINFTLQFTAYVDQNDPTSLVYESSEIPLFNENDYSCDFNENRRSIKFTSRISSNNDIVPVNNTKRFMGKMGQIIDSGSWKNQPGESFSFKIDGKQYFWGQSILERYNVWFIHELLPDGRIGDETDRRMVSDYCNIVVPIHIKGKAYFYGFSSSTYTWLATELLPGGRMSRETHKSVFRSDCSSAFLSSIDGSHYFYISVIINGTNKLTRSELSTYGNKTTPAEVLDDFYSNYNVVFPFFINGRHFYCGYNTDTQNWFIRELLRGGVLGKITDSGTWSTKFQVWVPFKIDGRQYVYAQSVQGDRDWIIQEILPNGRMGEEIDDGDWDDDFTPSNSLTVAVTYNINGKQFLYLHNKETKQWVIRSLN